MVSVPPLHFDRGARRIALWGLTTLSTVALLFSYKTSTSSSTASRWASRTSGDCPRRSVSRRRSAPSSRNGSSRA